MHNVYSDTIKRKKFFHLRDHIFHKIGYHMKKIIMANEIQMYYIFAFIFDAICINYYY